MDIYERVKTILRKDTLKKNKNNNTQQIKCPYCSNEKIDIIDTKMSITSVDDGYDLKQCECPSCKKSFLIESFLSVYHREIKKIEK